MPNPINDTANARPIVGWAGVDGIAKHAHEQALRYLSSQLEVAKSADQRAITASSVFAAAATAMIGFAATQGTLDISLPTCVSALLLIAAAAFCAYAARPIDFYFPGNEPRCWWENVHDSIDESLQNELQVMQEMIDENSTYLRSNAEAIKTAMRLAIGAPLVGFALWLVVLAL
jgi:hypothetical protein